MGQRRAAVNGWLGVLPGPEGVGLGVMGETLEEGRPARAVLPGPRVPSQASIARRATRATRSAPTATHPPTA